MTSREQRLASAARSVIQFLEGVEWSDRASEDEADELVEELHAALSDDGVMGIAEGPL